MNRNVVRWLVLLLLPVMIVATPNVASAATYGPSVGGSFSFDEGSLRPANGGKCNLTAYWGHDVGYSVHVKRSCSFDWNSIGGDEGYYIDLIWNGVDKDGNLCESDNIRLTSQIGSGSGDISTDGQEPTCRMDEVCWNYTTGDPLLGGPATDSGCFVLDLGKMTAKVWGNCTKFNAAPPEKLPSITVDGTTSRRWVSDTKFQFDRPPTSGGYHLYVVYKGINGNTTGPTWWSPSSSSTQPNFFPGGALPHYVRLETSLPWNKTDGSPAQPERYEVIGAGLIDQAEHASTGTTWQLTPQANANGLMGVTDPGRCLFYWGEKIAAISGNDTDEPVSALNVADPGTTEPPTGEPEPPAESSGCTFSFNDPSTWATAGICALVELLNAVIDVLGDILSALASLASAIVGPIVDALGWLLDAILGIADAILDGLYGLFVPSDGFFDSKVTQLRQDFNATQPGAFLDAFTAQNYGLSASGCGGIPVDWQIEGKSFSFNLLGACSGFMATTAGVVKLAASALLVIFGAIACLRGLGAGFGWAPSMGKGAEA